MADCSRESRRQSGSKEHRAEKVQSRWLSLLGIELELSPQHQLDLAAGFRHRKKTQRTAAPGGSSVRGHTEVGSTQECAAIYHIWISEVGVIHDVVSVGPNLEPNWVLASPD